MLPKIKYIKEILSIGGAAGAGSGVFIWAVLSLQSSVETTMVSFSTKLETSINKVETSINNLSAKLGTVKIGIAVITQEQKTQDIQIERNRSKISEHDRVLLKNH